MNIDTANKKFEKMKQTEADLLVYLLREQAALKKSIDQGPPDILVDEEYERVTTMISVLNRINKQDEDLKRIYSLPEREWVQATSVIMQALAFASRHGGTDLAKAAMKALDEGRTRQDRLEGKIVELEKQLTIKSSKQE